MAPQHEQSTAIPALPVWAYRAIFSQIHEGVIVSSLNGNFRRMNQAAAELYGYEDPSSFERQLPKLSSIFELRTYPGRKLMPYKDWPISKLRHGSKTVSTSAYVKRKDKRHELILHYEGQVITDPDGKESFAILNVYDLTARIRDQQALKLEQERLTLAQKAGRIGTFEWQIPADKLIWSDEMAFLYGMKPGEFGGSIKHHNKLLHADDRQRIDQLMKRTFRLHQRHFETEWRVPLSDSTLRHLLCKAEITYDTEGRPLRMIGINMDITQRRQAAQAYKASVDRQSAFFKTALDAIITVDSEGEISEFNPAAERIFGYNRKAIIGANLSKLISPPEQHRARNASAKSLIANYPMIADKPVEGVAVRKNGQEFPAELFITRIGSEEPPAYMLSLRDITERKRAEEELRASERRFRFMAESMPQKIFTADADGRIDYINPQWMEYIGMTFPEISKRGFSTVIHPDDIEDVRRKWKAAVTSGEPYETEQRIRNAAGEYHWHLSRANAMRDAQGRIIKWIGSNTDIEDVRQRQALEERTAMLTEQREQLVALNRAKDEFISLASHQLRTPATGVKQYVGMLLQGYFGELTEDQMAMVRSAFESNERQLGIINALLNVARLDAGKVKLQAVPCDITQLLEDIVNEQTEVFRVRQQTLTLRTPREQVVCDADPQLLRMVLENIIDNAGKYSPPDKNIEVRLSETADAVLIAITDQGVGMRKRDQEKLFQKFSRIDNELSTQASGSGLGLYWAKKIMDLHGGSIAVSSKIHKGSTFTITIPKQIAAQ